MLLLGYAGSADAALCLREAASRKEMVKLTLSSKPVPMSLPAQVAMARLGAPDAILALRRLFDAPDLPMTLFLLGVLRDIEDRSVLLAGVRLLNDDRQAPGVSAHGTRHVHDVALEALVARLTLRPSFRIEPGRHYAPNEIAEIRTAAEQALTRPDCEYHTTHP